MNITGEAGGDRKTKEEYCEWVGDRTRAQRGKNMSPRLLSRKHNKWVPNGANMSPTFGHPNDLTLLPQRSITTYHQEPTPRCPAIACLPYYLVFRQDHVLAPIVFACCGI